MKLGEYQQISVFYFKSAVKYGILANLLITMEPMLPPELLLILACPVCKGELFQSETDLPLHCPRCNRHYPVTDDVPILFSEQTTVDLLAKGEAA